MKRPSWQSTLELYVARHCADYGHASAVKACIAQPLSGDGNFFRIVFNGVNLKIRSFREAPASPIRPDRRQDQQHKSRTHSRPLEDLVCRHGEVAAFRCLLVFRGTLRRRRFWFSIKAVNHTLVRADDQPPICRRQAESISFDFM